MDARSVKRLSAPGKQQQMLAFELKDMDRTRRDEPRVATRCHSLHLFTGAALWISGSLASGFWPVAYYLDTPE